MSKLYSLHIGFFGNMQSLIVWSHLGRGWVFSHRNIWNYWVEMNPEPVLNAPHPPCNTEQCAQLGLLTLLGSAHAILCHFTHCSYCLPMFPSADTIMALLSQPHGFFFPSDSNYKSIRAGLASGKWNQLLSLSQNEDLKWSSWTFWFPSFCFLFCNPSNLFSN